MKKPPSWVAFLLPVGRGTCMRPPLAEGFALWASFFCRQTKETKNWLKGGKWSDLSRHAARSSKLAPLRIPICYGGVLRIACSLQPTRKTCIVPAPGLLPHSGGCGSLPRPPAASPSSHPPQDARSAGRSGVASALTGKCYAARRATKP